MRAVKKEMGTMKSAASDADDPAHRDTLRAHLCLALVEGIGPLAMGRLIDQFESAAQVLQCSPSELQGVQGIGPKLAQRIASARDRNDVEQQLALVKEHDLDILLPTDTQYPPLLQEIHDPPIVLFTRGRLQPSDSIAVAIVGTRHASRYGLEQAKRLAGSLAAVGITVVSGMARGIDSAAHRGALEAGGRTVAVLAGGLLNPYPPENAQLADKIAAQGCLLSESAPSRQPLRGLFPQRNRIISGLSLGTIVVEAPQRSGALITARLALEQGREVFAVPGPIDSRVSHGPHQLLRDGAKLVASVDDVLEELGPMVETASRNHGTDRTIHSPAEMMLNHVEQRVLQAIEPTGSLVDEVVATCGLPVHRVLSTISVLEMRHLVRRLGGNRLSRS
ncbi:MAG: DNA-processing protein DprA [Pirellulales bacterium]